MRNIQRLFRSCMVRQTIGSIVVHSAWSGRCRHVSCHISLSRLVSYRTRLTCSRYRACIRAPTPASWYAPMATLLSSICPEIFSCEGPQPLHNVIHPHPAMDARHSASSGRVWSRESIALILRHHLDIPEERFFKMDLEEFNRRQRDAAYTRGVSWDPWRLLLVCKTWRAVGEPLLYHTIVVRTQPQAQTLMETFRGNAALAPYIRRLRLEGAFGLAGSQVLHFASATAVDVWLHITHADGDRILVHPQGVALSWINPRRVAIHDDLDNPARFGEPMRELVSQALRRWSHLVRPALQCSRRDSNWDFQRHITYSLEDARGAYARAIAHNLAGSTTLEILEIPEGSAPSLALLILGTTPPTLRKVIVHGPLSDEISSWLSSQLPTVIMDCRSVRTVRVYRVLKVI